MLSILQSFQSLDDFFNKMNVDLILNKQLMTLLIPEAVEIHPVPFS
jgi:hypothetical protein